MSWVEPAPEEIFSVSGFLHCSVIYILVECRPKSHLFCFLICSPMCENLCLTVISHSGTVFIQNSKDCSMNTLFFFNNTVLKIAFFFTYFVSSSWSLSLCLRSPNINSDIYKRLIRHLLIKYVTVIYRNFNFFHNVKELH